MFAQLMGLKTISPGICIRLMQREHITAIDVNSRQSCANARGRGRGISIRSRSTDHDLPTDLDAPLIFELLEQCSAGRHRMLCAPGKGMGYRNVRVMSAGISGWLNADCRAESGGV